MLLCQRRAALATTCVNSCGADLDLSLTLADGKSNGAADPAFEAHVGIILFWSLANWEAWAPRALLQNLISSSRSRLDRAKSPWSVVYGPVAAFVATLRRLGWVICSAIEVSADDGTIVNFLVDSPAYVRGVDTAPVQRWRWSRVEEKFPSSDSGGAGRGAEWRVATKALNCKDSCSWGHRTKRGLAFCH